jgi:hypothetical protein
MGPMKGQAWCRLRAPIMPHLGEVSSLDRVLPIRILPQDLFCETTKYLQG